jgi:hypothetical protein
VSPFAAVLALAVAAALLMALGFYALAIVSGLAAVMLAVSLVRIVLRMRRRRTIIPSETVLRAIQSIRATLTHMGAAEARAVLDDLEQRAKDRPEGLPETNARFKSAYFDLEDRMRNLGHMAEIARFYVVESSGSNSPHETEERKREGELAVFAVRQCEQMASALVNDYYAAFKTSAETPS